MAKDSSVAISPFLRGLFQGGLYKRNQGRITRQATFAAFALGFALAAWRLSVYLESQPSYIHYLVPAAILALGIWISYRVVNVPRFADFLIAVEAEVNKVSWPTRDMLFRSTIVVMFTIFALAAILFLYDLIWSRLLGWLGVTG